MFSSFNTLRKAKQLIRKGDLEGASRIVAKENLADQQLGKRVAMQLTDRLVERAGRFSCRGQLDLAWQAITLATEVANNRQLDELARKSNQLVEKTIDQAQANLLRGDQIASQSCLKLLSERGIRDRRADDMEQACNLLNQVDELAVSGRLGDALVAIQEVQALRPEMHFLDQRARQLREQAGHLEELTHQLRFAINQSAWSGARSVSEQILEIAPENQMALDARRRCDRQEEFQQKSVFYVDAANAQETTIERNIRSTHRVAPSGVDPCQQQAMITDDKRRSASGLMRSFMLWIDGVGGFLVCTNPLVTVGRAIPNCEIDIPVQGDLRRRHLQLKRVGGRFLVRDLNRAESNSKDLEHWDLLNDGQAIDLQHGVGLRFSQTHPLGNSARLEFTSRHRTEPWSDAILLMGDALVLGADKSSHIVCGDWTQKLVIFRKGDEIYLRAAGTLDVNGSSHIGDVLLQDKVRIVGDEFAISCEEVHGFQ